MVVFALFIFLIAITLNSLNTMTGASCIDRPIFIGGFLGLILGDVKTGVLIGAQLELIFMGIATIGPGGQAADILGSAVICVTLGITQNIPIETVVPLGMAIGYAGVVFNAFRYLVGEFTIPLTDKAFKEGNQRKYTTISIIFHFLASAARYFWIVPAIMFGGDLISALIEKTPQFIIQGITVAGGILPGIGFAVILTYLWNTKLAIFFFVGFTVLKYLGVDMMFLFVMAVAIGLYDLFMKMDIAQKKASVSSESAAKESEEEAFLS